MTHLHFYYYYSFLFVPVRFCPRDNCDSIFIIFRPFLARRYERALFHSNGTARAVTSTYNGGTRKAIRFASGRATRVRRWHRTSKMSITKEIGRTVREDDTNEIHTHGADCSTRSLQAARVVEKRRRIYPRQRLRNKGAKSLRAESRKRGITRNRNVISETPARNFALAQNWLYDELLHYKRNWNFTSFPKKVCPCFFLLFAIGIVRAQ